MLKIKIFLFIFFFVYFNSLLSIYNSPIITLSQELKSETKSNNIFEEAHEEVERETIGVSGEILEAYNNHVIWNYWHFKWVYNWNFISTIIIFFIVNIMVLAGLYFSYLQFKQSLLMTKVVEKQEEEKKETAEASMPESKISLAINKIEITSSVIGLLILTLSFAFFYLYIVHVYPVSVDKNLPLLNDNSAEDNQI